VEIDAIRALADADQVVIACGGGGIPVLEQQHKLQGASAVIEKDLAAGRLAELVDADELIILTGEDYVYKNYGQPNQTPIPELSIRQAQELLDADALEAGTIRPKVQAAVDFIGNSAVRQATIRSLDADQASIGTRIHKL
jgi:carbamate kinase